MHSFTGVTTRALRRSLIALAASVSGAGALPAQAQDGLDACGNIRVEAEAQCEVVPPSVDCEGMCTPVTVRAACDARVVAECDGRCNELPSVDCTGQCVADCSAECTVDPGEFDCQATCEADCSGRCQGACSASDDEAECMALCEGSCDASCESRCDVELPEADCEGRCEASCDGSCRVETNIDCQIECQLDVRGDCEADLTGGCELDCQREDGALFCDGQYVDHGEDLQQCLDALQNLDVEVETEAHGEARGSASVDSSCSVTDPGAKAASFFPVLGALSLLALSYRRNRSC